MRGTTAIPVALALLALASTAAARDIHVPGDHRRLQDAVDAAAPGDRILVHRGTHRDVEVKTGGIEIVAGRRARFAGPPRGRYSLALDVQADGVALRALRFVRGSLRVHGEGVRVEDCVFSRTRNRFSDPESRWFANAAASVVGGEAVVAGNTVLRSRRTSSGIVVRGDGAVVTGNRVEGRVALAGLLVAGDGATVEENEVVVGGGAAGIRATVTGGSLAGNRVRGGDLRVFGDANRIEDNAVEDAALGQASVLAIGDGNLLSGNGVAGGLDTGVLVIGNGNRVEGGRVSGSGSVLDGAAIGHGVVVRGSGNVLAGVAVEGCAGEAFRIAGNGERRFVFDPLLGFSTWRADPLGPGNRVEDCTATGAGACGLGNFTVDTEVTGGSFTGNGVDVVSSLPVAVFADVVFGSGGPGLVAFGNCGATDDTHGGAFAPEEEEEEDPSLPPAPPPLPAVADSDFAPGPFLLQGRARHTASALPGGRVLLAGGQGWDGTALFSAELVDPSLEATFPVGDLAAARRAHAAVVLADGRVLVCGGYGGAGVTLATAEIFDPGEGTWFPAAPMAGDRAEHTATLLGDGRVLVVGGYSNASGTLGYAGTSGIYDPAADAWSPGPEPAAPRGGHTASLLPDGRVLLVGGARFGERVAEIYDPATGLLSRTAGDPAQHRVFHAAAPTGTGGILLAGGGPPAAEVFDPATGTFRYAGACPAIGLPTVASVERGALLPMPGNRALLVGGLAVGGAPDGGDLVLAALQIWDTVGGSGGGGFTALVMELPVPRAAFTATPLGDGSYLLAGGYGTAGPAAGNERRTTIFRPR